MNCMSASSFAKDGGAPALGLVDFFPLDLWDLMPTSNLRDRRYRYKIHRSSRELPGVLSNWTKRDVYPRPAQWVVLTNRESPKTGKKVMQARSKAVAKTELQRMCTEMRKEGSGTTRTKKWNMSIGGFV